MASIAERTSKGGGGRGKGGWGWCLYQGYDVEDGGFAGSSGSGRLRISSKYSIHLAVSSLSVVITFPYLYFTGILCHKTV